MTALLTLSSAWERHFIIPSETKIGAICNWFIWNIGESWKCPICWNIWYTKQYHGEEALYSIKLWDPGRIFHEPIKRNAHNISKQYDYQATHIGNIQHANHILYMVRSVV